MIKDLLKRRAGTTLGVILIAIAIAACTPVAASTAERVDSLGHTFPMNQIVDVSTSPELAGVTGDKEPTQAAGSADNGEQGPVGLQGEKGDKGDTGPAGPQGLKGDKGDTGAFGPSGLQGEHGLVGPQGLKGDTGATGQVASLVPRA